MAQELTMEQMEQINKALQGGRKIQAIKLYRQFTGLGLKEAKEFIDELEANLQLQFPDKFPQTKGCMVLIVAFLLIYNGVLSLL